MREGRRIHRQDFVPRALHPELRTTGLPAAAHQVMAAHVPGKIRRGLRSPGMSVQSLPSETSHADHGGSAMPPAAVATAPVPRFVWRELAGVALLAAGVGSALGLLELFD